MTAPSLFAASDDPQDAPDSTSAVAHAPARSTTGYASTSSLYRKHRPQSFAAEEFVGQEHVVRTLRNAVALGRVGHAYLFSGPRGTGKTTMARLLAKAVNCLDPDPNQRPCNACANCRAINDNATTDIIEIDAASNRGIDDIRDLRERVRYAPTQLPSKVYIIDEAHQITGAAANAFLKTLEEPPAHTRFILATTDPEELLPTIVSRCQRFEFRRVGTGDIARRLRTVASLEDIAVSDEALQAIARHATGSLRDALGLLERLSLAAAASDSGAPATIDVADVTGTLGLSRNDRVENLIEAIGQRDAGKALRIVQEAIDEGEDARQLNRQLLNYIRLLLFERSGGSADADDRARALAVTFSLGELADLARRLGEIDFSIKHAPYPQLPLEVALVEATAGSEISSRAAEPLQSLTQPDSAPVRQPTSLRDRVRGGSALRETPAPAPPPPNRADPAPITPLRPDPAAAPPAVRPPSQGADEVERIADLWPNVRADVKALNRRIEALLSEVDPVAVSGNQITLAVPYPFHRDKLNSDEVRETVAGVLSRLLGRDVSLVCILRGEVSASGAPASSDTGTPSAATTRETAPAEESAEDKRVRARITAAKNIFDAEEIIDAEPAPQPEERGNG
jgi:DNA polymerase-3 subunit gamma/tau